MLDDPRTPAHHLCGPLTNGPMLRGARPCIMHQRVPAGNAPTRVDLKRSTFHASTSAGRRAGAPPRRSWTTRSTAGPRASADAPPPPTRPTPTPRSAAGSAARHMCDCGQAESPGRRTWPRSPRRARRWDRCTDSPSRATPDLAQSPCREPPPPTRHRAPRAPRQVWDELCDEDAPPACSGFGADRVCKPVRPPSIIAQHRPAYIVPFSWILDRLSSLGRTVSAVRAPRGAHRSH